MEWSTYGEVAATGVPLHIMLLGGVWEGGGGVQTVTRNPVCINCHHLAAMNSLSYEAGVRFWL